MENIYNKMKGLLGMTEELSEETSMMAEAFLVDGTTIKTDSDRFEEGSMVFVVGEDDERKGEEEIQELTNKHVGEIDQIVLAKEKELMIV